MESCVFCGIVAGRVPSHTVYEDDATVAFLDLRPVFIGHTLVVPREHHETLPDLPDGQTTSLMNAVRHLSGAVRDGMESDGTFVCVNNTVSQSVPHLHFHVIPRRFKDGLRGFLWPRLRYESEEALRETAAAIRSAAMA